MIEFTLSDNTHLKKGTYTFEVETEESLTVMELDPEQFHELKQEVNEE